MEAAWKEDHGPGPTQGLDQPLAEPLMIPPQRQLVEKLLSKKPAIAAYQCFQQAEIEQIEGEFDAI